LIALSVQKVYFRLKPSLAKIFALLITLFVSKSLICASKAICLTPCLSVNL